MAVLQRDQMQRMSPRVVKRNAFLLQVLAYMAEEPASATMICAHFRVSSANARKAVNELKALNLLDYMGDKPSASTRGNSQALYRPAFEALERATRILPVTVPDDFTPHIKVTPQVCTDFRVPPRDALDTLLFGTGRAPSLNFTNS